MHGRIKSIPESVSDTRSGVHRSSAPPELPSSVCLPASAGVNLTVAGTCTLDVPRRGLAVSGGVLLSDGSTLTGSVMYDLLRYQNVIMFNNSDGSSSYRQTSSHSVTWSYSRRHPSEEGPLSSSNSNHEWDKNHLSQPGRRDLRASLDPSTAVLSSLMPSRLAPSKPGGDVDMHYTMKYNWANSGDFSVNGVWENSFNFTGSEGRGQKTSQRHYQVRYSQSH